MKYLSQLFDAMNPQKVTVTSLMRCKLLALVSILLSQLAMATVTITSVTGTSVATDLTLNVPKIIGGVSGISDCTSVDTCNSCLEAWNNNQDDNKCNENQIGDSTQLTITFNSTTSGTIELRDRDGNLVPSFPSQSYTAGSTTSVTFAWNIICNAGTGANCSVINDTPSEGFSTNFNFGINSDGDSDIDDNKEINFIVAGIPNGESDATEGIKEFALYPGDGKAYIELLDVVDYVFQGANAAKVLFYIAPAPGAGCSGAEDSISFNNDVAAVELLTDEGTTTKTFAAEFFEGLDNGVEYDVRPAFEDEAGNRGLFYNNLDPCLQYRNSVLPQPVSGLLSDGSGCFIATAAYGTAYDKHVQVLRLFRDMYLMKNTLGQKFVQTYYKYSPQIANTIRESQTLKWITRVLLTPVWAVGYSMVHYGALITLVWISTAILIAFFVFRKKRVLLFQKKNLKIFLVFLVSVFVGSISFAQESSTTSEELSDIESEIYSTEQQPQPPPPEISAPAESAPLEPPYTGVEGNEFENLENSIEQVTPETSEAQTEAPAETPAPAESSEESENYTVDPNVKESPEKWQPYQRVPEPSRIKELNEKEGLTRITKKGEFIYDVNQSPQNSAASFRFGTFEGPNLEGPNGVTFQEVYGEDTKFLLLADYEWQFFKKFGKLGIRVGSGIMFAEGKGFFTAPTFFDDGSGAVPVTEAQESYNLFVFPNNLGLVYRAQFYDRQWLVPFAEVGIDYFAIVEYRDDGEETNFGGSPHFHFALGGSFSLNTLSRDLAINVDREYGINNMWLTAEYRRLELITGDFDFSDDIYSAGFMFEF